MTIYVYSLEYDKCFAASTTELMLRDNQSLINEIRERINNGNNDKVVICIGSVRQNHFLDETASEKNKVPSLFVAYPALRDAIKSKITDDNNRDKISLDPFLTTDAINDKAPGTYFDQGTLLNAANGSRMNVPMVEDALDLTDASKISILYAQMNRMACQNKSEEITFFFKDWNEENLTHLHQFYKKHEFLIPKNVTLHLSQQFSNQNKIR